MNLRRYAFLSLLVATTGLGGCGDDSKSTPAGPTVTATLPAATPTPAASPQPADSNLGASTYGGGCYPEPLNLDSPLDMLTLINPEWSPAVNGPVIESKPVLVHGTIMGGHGDTGGDFPSTHTRSDVNTFIELDDADAARYATANPHELAIEWEAGAYPDWAWGSPGDDIVALGRWIFDCGHPDAHAGHCSAATDVACVIDAECKPAKCPMCQADETCVGVKFGYSSELHPPYASAVIRHGRGAVLKDGSAAQPATNVDVFINAFGGGAGDRCVLTHLRNPMGQLASDCYPLKDPVNRAVLNSRDFEFDVPLPPKPAGTGKAIWKVTQRDTPGEVPAAIDIQSHENDSTPHLTARVLLTQMVGGQLPNTFAGRVSAGWEKDTTALVHVRVHIDAAVIRNPLRPKVPAVATVGDLKRWRLQAALNGEWREFSGLDVVERGDVIAQNIVFDDYVPASGRIEIIANGAADDCISSVFGHSLKEELARLGFGDGLTCILTSPHSSGEARARYDGPDFGSGQSYETISQGGDGGHCTADASQQCLSSADCASGDTCTVTGDPFALRYHIERLPS